jgi:tetratricopeptide (TPR) repeat protein
MKSESIAFAIAGVAFGFLAGWIVGDRYATLNQPPQVAASAPAQAPAAAPPAVDLERIEALEALATDEPTSAGPRIELGNLYFDAERYADAIKWYTAALELSPDDVNVRTDLGVAYYYTNQPDRALSQFEQSLQVDPTHTKTILNVGIVKAFGQQDLAGAEEAWEKVIALDPDSPEGGAARRALDSLRSAHPRPSDVKPGA